MLISSTPRRTSTLSQPQRGKISVAIPEDLYESIKKRIEGKGFSTPDDFVTYVLRVSMGKQQDSSAPVDDDEKVIEQLKALGYI